MFLRMISVKKSKSPGAGLRDAALVFPVEQQVTTNLATEQDSFIISWFPWVRSPDTEDWVFCSGVYQASARY